MNVSNMEHLKFIDRTINMSLGMMFDNPFELEEAMLFGVQTFNGEEPLIAPITKASDIYQILDSITVARELQPYDQFMFVTTGWAAQVSADTDVSGELPPSKRPDSKRVRVLMFVDGGEVLSSVRFSDSDEVMYNEESGYGTLMDAIHSLVSARNALAQKERKTND